MLAMDTCRRSFPQKAPTRPTRGPTLLCQAAPALDEVCVVVASDQLTRDDRIWILFLRWWDRNSNPPINQRLNYQIKAVDK